MHKLLSNIRNFEQSVNNFARFHYLCTRSSTGCG